jgi:hypothetical protein
MTRWLRRALAHLFSRHHRMLACVTDEHGIVWYHVWCRECEPEVGEMVQNAKRRGQRCVP